MVATAADYSWFGERFPELAEAYCLTLVRGLSPPQVLARLGARTNGPRVTGVGGLPVLGLSTPDEQLVAVTVVDDWALAVESDGGLGVTEEATVPLSAGTRLVSHVAGGKGAGRFCWVEDGEVRAAFEALFPSRREGSTPDEPLAAMRAAGFVLDGDNSKTSAAAAFALAEHLTGVRITPELLSDAPYQCGLAPIP